MIDTTYYASYNGVESVADITVDHFLDLFQLQDGKGLPFIENEKLYRNDGTVNENMGLDWFEKGVARPDMVGCLICHRLSSILRLCTSRWRVPCLQGGG